MTETRLSFANSFNTAFLLAALAACSLSAQTETNKVPLETEPGIPVTDKLTVEKCATCHKADEHGNLTRISWIRTTPEGWEEAIKRMVRINGLAVTPQEARQIVTYLSQDHGLAPEETESQRWFLENREPEAEFVPSPEVRMACGSCHAFARPLTWRRSATEWKLLENMHIGYFPVSEYNSFHAHPRSDGYGILPASMSTTAGAPGKDPVDFALDYLTKNCGLHSAAWSNWRAQEDNPKLAGEWLVSASSPGKGKYFGTLTITSGSAPNLVETQMKLTSMADGSRLAFAGHAVVYTGYEWRGRSVAEGIGEIREVMTVSADQSKIAGRWYWGGYDEFGFNISAQRSSRSITVLGTDITSVRAGSKNVKVRVIGENLPRGLSSADIDLGPGVHVTKVLSSEPADLSVLADVDANAISGLRRVSVKDGVAANCFAVYDKIDYIKVSNDSALARLGGVSHPKGYVQFEAIAYNRGVDGLSNTADDIDLGPVKVTWSIEEFVAHYNDNDKEFVGSINNDGLFTPALEGPNPQRRFSTNNTGDVWVVAHYNGTGAGSSPITAKSYLVVTVPDYLKWDQPEIAQ